MKEDTKSISLADMQMRDWFASLAMQGLIASDMQLNERMARNAYAIADLMLKARAE